MWRTANTCLYRYISEQRISAQVTAVLYVWAMAFRAENNIALCCRPLVLTAAWNVKNVKLVLCNICNTGWWFLVGWYEFAGFFLLRIVKRVFFWMKVGFLSHVQYRVFLILYFSCILPNFQSAGVSLLKVHCLSVAIKFRVYVVSVICTNVVCIMCRPVNGLW